MAHAWITAWNAHDLEHIVEHYADDIEFTSPFAVQLLGAPDGTVRGKAALHTYFQKALDACPDLHFNPIRVLSSVNSISITYRSVRE